jgi:MFS family permease
VIDEGRRKWWILAAMGGILGTVVLDQTVVGVALPTIRDDLGMSQVAAHWIVNGYLLMLTCLAVTGGRLGDLWGHGRPLFGGLALFALASLAACLAQDGVWLITARLAQGVGAAMIFPATAAMITAVFEPSQRGMALGVFGAIGGGFFALGPTVGGGFTEILSWRWVFWINLPIVVAVALVVLVFWRDLPQRGPRPRLDVGGLIALLVGLGALVTAIMQGASWGWSAAPTLALLALAAVVLVTFVLIERRKDRKRQWRGVRARRSTCSMLSRPRPARI